MVYDVFTGQNLLEDYESHDFYENGEIKTSIEFYEDMEEKDIEKEDDSTKIVVKNSVEYDQKGNIIKRTNSKFRIPNEPRKPHHDEFELIEPELCEEYQYHKNGETKKATCYIGKKIKEVRQYDKYGRPLSYLEYDDDGKLSERTEYKYERCDSSSCAYTKEQRVYDGDGKLNERTEFKYKTADSFYSPYSKPTEVHIYDADGKEIVQKHGVDEIADGIHPTENQIKEVIEESIEAPSKDEKTKTVNDK